MKQLYEKSEITFAIVWIVVYVVVIGNLRASFGDASPAMLAGLVVLVALSLVFLRSTNTWEKYGLTSWPDSRRYLYFIPFLLLISTNLWAGIVPRYGGMGQIYAAVSMVLVGWVEEIIFRGFLFRAMEKNGPTRAIVVSAITFGAGHIVNLLTGHASVETLLQVCYATAIGFAFVMVFHKSGSLWPCIVTHSLINMLSTFANQDIPARFDTLLTYGAAIFIIVVACGYALYLSRMQPSD